MSGCVAVAAFPAAGADRSSRRPRTTSAKMPSARSASAAAPKSRRGRTDRTSRSCRRPTAPSPPVNSAAAPQPGKVPPGMQYLYGSGEAAALSYQAYLGLTDLMIAQVERSRGRPYGVFGGADARIDARRAQVRAVRRPAAGGGARRRRNRVAQPRLRGRRQPAQRRIRPAALGPLGTDRGERGRRRRRA